MGNSPDFDEKKDSIIWLDQNVFNEENNATFEYYKSKLSNFNFIRFKSVKDISKFIESKRKYFEFRLFYTIVSGRLAEEYYTEYIKLIEEYNIFSANIVYCMRQKYHETKPYFNDAFLNTGKITTNFEDVVDYILKDEFKWANICENTNNTEVNNPQNEGYGDVFLYMDTNNAHELYLPIVLGKLINSSLIEKGAIEKFQVTLLKRYYDNYSKDDLRLIKPSYNKNIDIPLHLLSKAFFKFYTLEGKNKSFYKDLNRDLTNQQFDDYHPFIFLLYDSINKGFMKSYKDELYRGGILSKVEFDNIMKQNDINKNKNLFYFKIFHLFQKRKRLL